MNKINEKYTALRDKETLSYKNFKKQYNFVGGLRLSMIIALAIFIYYYFTTSNPLFIYLGIVALIIFFILIKVSGRIAFRRNVSKTIVKINENELSYLKKESIPFDDGEEYIDPKHAYTYDLDFFGKHSLFQNINRTATYIGKSTLANRLKSTLQKGEIELNQQAIIELTSKIEFRQKINALGKIGQGSKDLYEDLVSWLHSNISTPSTFQKVFSIASPIVLLIFIIIYFSGGSILYRHLAVTLFFINLGVLGSNLKAIKSELVSDTKIDDILKSYSLIIQSIENENFESEKLVNLKSKLSDNGVVASEQIKHLSSLFSQLDSLQNLIGAFLMNGLALYHLHVFRRLIKWKKNHAQHVEEWLNVVGEFEALGSFANFSFNNPSFTYPSINEEDIIIFKDLGHPLIDKDVRVDNSVAFDEQNFIILTGSNMSGKSTFLRSLGINMVLANIGSSICATSASITPSKVWVSMRLSDSLEDNESYFFAEVKRLKEIMVNTKVGPSFILLDEILRGTNSDDKRLGTVEVIKKLISQNAVGAIATHDLEVCLTTDEYPDKLTNKCFEVEIIDNELYFDYKLRDGICRNKSATFLMEKMGVI